MVRFASVRLAAVVVAVLILGATLVGAAALPWNPLQGLSHSCPPGAPPRDCFYPSRPAWVLPTAFVIGLVGFAAASSVLAAPRRSRTPGLPSEKHSDATEQMLNLMRTNQPRRPL